MIFMLMLTALVVIVEPSATLATQEVCPTTGPEDHGTRAPRHQNTSGPEDHRTRGRTPEDHGAAGCGLEML